MDAAFGGLEGLPFEYSWTCPHPCGCRRRPDSRDGQADDEVEPSFSADGTRIVYSRPETDGIYAVGAFGGNLGGSRRPMAPQARHHLAANFPSTRFDPTPSAQWSAARARYHEIEARLWDH